MAQLASYIQIKSVKNDKIIEGRWRCQNAFSGITSRSKEE